MGQGYGTDETDETDGRMGRASAGLPTLALELIAAAAHSLA
jgi:hypothetical protein